MYSDESESLLERLKLRLADNDGSEIWHEVDALVYELEELRAFRATVDIALDELGGSKSDEDLQHFVRRCLAAFDPDLDK